MDEKLLNIHGSVMVFASMVFISTGIFFLSGMVIYYIVVVNGNVSENLFGFKYTDFCYLSVY